MKFTALNAKESILAKLGNTRKLSDRSIDEMIVNAMAFASDETELADFLKNAEPMFVTANGNLIKDQSDFAKDWETKNPKTPTPTVISPVTPTGGLSAEDVAAIVSKSLEPFVSKLGQIDNERTTESTFAQAQKTFLSTNRLDETNEQIKEIKDRVFSTVKSTIGKDSRAEDIAATMKSEFDVLARLARIDTPYVPAEASGVQNGAGSAEFYRNQRDDLQKEGFIKKVPGQAETPPKK